ncbi:hypothetical protein AX16_000018 [Volvariella volvacea WC 439]|nr:hypothetical protein AX16_000018 [Volvariella volvacea WC 439]
MLRASPPGLQLLRANFLTTHARCRQLSRGAPSLSRASRSTQVQQASTTLRYKFPRPAQITAGGVPVLTGSSRPHVVGIGSTTPPGPIPSYDIPPPCPDDAQVEAFSLPPPATSSVRERSPGPPSKGRRTKNASTTGKQDKSTVKPPKLTKQRKKPTVRSLMMQNKPRPYAKLLRVLATTMSPDEAWQAYSTLLSRYPLHSELPSIVPFSHLHRVCRILARNRPKTRTQFLRLLSVLSTIHNAHGRIHCHEWNALIHHAGRGWRKTRPEDYRLALNLYTDMITGKAPGTTAALSNSSSAPLQPPLDVESVTTAPVKPDIYTYSTLISIAARTLDSHCILHAHQLIQESGLEFGRVAHLSMLIYHAVTNRLSGVRKTLRKLEEGGYTLGPDAIGACIWAYGLNQRLDIVWTIYRVLRYNTDPDLEDVDEIAAARHYLQEDEGIVIPSDLRPDSRTYAMVVQIMGYHGDFVNMLTTFHDLMAYGESSSQVDELSESLSEPLMGTIFRSIFLAFSKHGISPNFNQLSGESSWPPAISARVKTYGDRDQEAMTQWTLENLQPLFDIFVNSYMGRPNRSIVHWIMVAFDKASGHDVVLLRKVWKELETKFNGPFAGPDNRLWKWQRELFPEEEEREELRKVNWPIPT